MRARDVMSHPVTTIGANATLREAARLLVNTRVSALPVVDERGALAGIVSEADLIRRVTGEPAVDAALSSKVADVLTREVITATEDTELEDVARLMLKHRTKRIPIVRGSSVVGVVSRIDLVKAMLSTTEPPPGTSRAPEPAGDDETLRSEVAAAINRLHIPLGGSFDAVVSHGIAHLWGRVSTEDEDRACVLAASKVPGISDVRSHMQVVARPRWA
jgi:CBS domain-containing protein